MDLVRWSDGTGSMEPLPCLRAICLSPRGKQGAKRQDGQLQLNVLDSPCQHRDHQATSKITASPEMLVVSPSLGT